MPRLLIYLILLMFLPLQSCCFMCRDDNVTYQVYEPISYSRAQLDSIITLAPARAIAIPGKIYVINDMLFIAEKNKGFHVFDNTNPKSPKNTKFITIPGATDIAIKANVMYINQGTDLLSFKFSTTLADFSLIKRVKNAFSALRAPDGMRPWDTPKDHVVVDWKLKKD